MGRALLWSEKIERTMSWACVRYIDMGWKICPLFRQLQKLWWTSQLKRGWLWFNFAAESHKWKGNSGWILWFQLLRFFFQMLWQPYKTHLLEMNQTNKHRSARKTLLYQAQSSSFHAYGEEDMVFFSHQKSWKTPNIPHIDVSSWFKRGRPHSLGIGHAFSVSYWWSIVPAFSSLGFCSSE